MWLLVAASGAVSVGVPVLTDTSAAECISAVADLADVCLLSPFAVGAGRVICKSSDRSNNAEVVSLLLCRATLGGGEEL